MVDTDELKERLQLLRDRLENATGVSPAECDLWEQKSSAYEVDHPEIAYTVRQVLDMLAKMGI